jgi:Type 9 secretion system plug protein 1st domain
MRCFLGFLLFCSCFSLKGQDFFSDSFIYTNHIFIDKIKTVQLYKEGWNLSYPILKLNSSEKLIFHFDLLDDQAETYYYKFIHCDKDWKKSDIFPNDYFEGYEDNPIEDYEASFNTTVSYYHYKLSFPNDRINIKLSGNYILLVYPIGYPENPVITQKFIVSENAVNINVTAHRPQMTKDNNTHQQLDFSVIYRGKNIIDPYRNIYATILQNGRWDNAKNNLKPDFYGNNELKYNSLSDKNIFKGGNEFRYFDIKSIRYLSEYIKSIDFVIPNYNVSLTPSENREFKPYFYWKDFNGKYFIAIQEGQDPNIDADYVYVYFTLPSKQMIPGGSIYVSGNLNNWAFDQKNIMTYNHTRQEYECTMLLKQGWYNYEYAYLKNGDTNGTASEFEGSHYETENDYTVLIYYRNPRDRYDRVIGFVTANTLNQLSY